MISADGHVICDNQTYYPEALDPKNAHLIAAAPELLEALKVAREYAAMTEVHHFNFAVVKADLGAIDAAIAKATGGAA